LLRAGRAFGLRVAGEVFADRTYQPDGSLTPRSRPDALISGEAAAVAQVLRMVREGVVRATDGTDVPVAADTVCVHGDGPRAVAFARRLNVELRRAGVAVRAFAS
ncbi:MAG: LamB/YcsF family protein, partial [Pseudomonadota bacterium]